MSNRAKVSWLLPSESGRSALPSGNRYATVGRFPEDGPQWPDGAWTVVLEFPAPPSEQGNPSFGSATFLAPDAPRSRLRTGQIFELYEGTRKVADVELIG